MRIARFVAGDDIHYAIVEGPAGEEELHLLVDDPIFGRIEPTGKHLALADHRLLAPILPRSKVVAVARNYPAHAAETDTEVPPSPLLFFKPNTSVIGPDDPIVLPDWSQRVDYEGELAVVIGRMTRNVEPEDALKYVYGYTCGNDVTARDVQAAESQWARAKGFDTACPLGPWIVTDLDTTALAVQTRLDGELRQDSTTAEMVFDVPYLVSFCSKAFTLLPGDVILTGTPAGIGPIEAGQVVEVTIEDIGTLRNPAVRR